VRREHRQITFREVGRRSALLILVPLVPAIAAAWLHPLRPAFYNDPIAIKGSQVPRSTPVLFVDARHRTVFVRGHLPGALNLNEDDWNANVEAVIQAWRPETLVVVYCDGTCDASRGVAQRLRAELGTPNVYAVSDGYAALKALLQ
jgi:rhodanese-related sulfurtransferase